MPRHDRILYSRREFGQLALAAVPALSTVEGPLSLIGIDSRIIDSRIRGVRIGVQSYSFRGMSLDDAIKAMADIGLGECAARSLHGDPQEVRQRRHPATGLQPQLQ